MANENDKVKPELTEQQAPLIPAQEQESAIPAPQPGEVLLQVVKTGKYFCVDERTYRRSFTDTTKFTVKKKPNK